MPGRRPLPPDRVRSEKIVTRATKAGKEAFLAACEQRAMTESDAAREAISEWTRKNAR